jgi:DNA-binding transcriptional regulator YhcF (GntR family)
MLTGRSVAKMLNDNKPMFIQIIEMIEDDIITGVYQENDIIISTTQISKLLSVNPTTSVKAVGIMMEDGILYKKRGIGMCVAEGAKEMIMKRRKEIFLKETVKAFLKEASKLGISEDELMKLIKECRND